MRAEQLSGRRTRTARAVALFAVLAVPVVALAVLGWTHRWVTDDAFFNLRVVKQIEAGHGPVFNMGERVEAGTSPLWIAMLTVGDLVTPLRLEWVAVGLGLALTLTGVALGEAGALALREDRHGIVLPLGALSVVVLAGMWDFTTSGLETGLGFAWLGASFYCLARLTRRPWYTRAQPGRVPWATALLLGVGPLVRPDFAIFAVVFLAALLVVTRVGGWWPRLGMVGAFLVLPVANELFRMAYYATLTPNTALAKEATRSYWSQGGAYFTNFESTYLLWIPFGLLVVAVAGSWFAQRVRERDVARVAVIAAPVVAASLHVVWVVRVGGDFMHARFLLPDWFVMVLPVFVVVVRGWRWFVAAGVVVWAVASIVSFRAPQKGPRGIWDERAYYVSLAGDTHPVLFTDNHNNPRVKAGLEANAAARAGGEGIFSGLTGQLFAVPIERRFHSRVVLDGSSGLASYAAGLDVWVVDPYGVADPIASRLELEKRGRPGHEKQLTVPWVVARFTPPGTAVPGVAPGEVDAARRALSCGSLRDLLDAITRPLGAGRAVENLVRAPSLTSLRIPDDPVAAARALCGR